MASELSYIIGEMKQRLEEYDQLIEKFGTFDQAMSAENVVRCADCAFYDYDNLLCQRYGLEKPVIMIDQGYCSCGIKKDIFDAMMERCRANGGWCTPGIILSADEIKRAMEEK